MVSKNIIDINQDKFRFLEQKGIFFRTLPHEFIHTQQFYRESSGYRSTYDDNNIDNVGIYDLSILERLWRRRTRKRQGGNRTSSYYAKNEELQARLHEIIAQGYTQWRKLPITKIELWAALHNFGMTTPKEILSTLKNTDEGQNALNTFKVHYTVKHDVSRVINVLNDVYKYVSEKDVQHAVWSNNYPLLYGELLEFYGDKLGRERFGMGYNPKPIVNVFYEFNKNHPLNDTDVIRLANSIPANLASNFLNGIVYRFQDGDHDTTEYANALKISEALLERIDVKKELFKDNQIIKNYFGETEGSPLDKALLKANSDMIRLLMDAGADPFQKFIVYDMRDLRQFETTPIYCIESAINIQNNLNAPHKLKGTLRKDYTEKDSRDLYKKYLEKLKHSIGLMLEYSKEPDKKHRIRFQGKERDISLREAIQELHSTPPIKHDRSHNFDHG